MKKEKGGFTLPGEAGYEELTLKIAKLWGADVIRDSDGTDLSDDILNSGYDIYSTICIIRDHNEWAKKNQDKLQQCFLSTSPKDAINNNLKINLLEEFSNEQFKINCSKESLDYWEVYDRTTNELVGKEYWSFDCSTGIVEVNNAKKWHKYTVSFLAYRIWEEISMYNHTTNKWDKEHLMQIDPIYEETQEFMIKWLKDWCINHPNTNVVRFTSMFYNFVWMWGNSERNRFLFTDWASYDFTVSPLVLKQFENMYGYKLKAEDFINKGKLQVTHMPATQSKRDYMEFITDFVVSFGKKLIDIVHSYGKKAYVFYDDSWVGIEPYHKKFKNFGFDGIIKAVFSGFESRLCSGVDVETHELRLHPYLFPVGVDGSPSFLEGGNPTLEAKKYWKNIRRAILRKPIQRIGLGGYLHLVEKEPDFVEYIAELADEFRMIRELHSNGEPFCFKPRIAILHYWGSLRSWTCSGHFHETYMHDLIHINESLSGLPFNVDFIDFKDVKEGELSKYDVVINAGIMGNAWSGGDAWRDTKIVELLTEWVYNGGIFIGVKEPSAVEGFDTTFRMAHILGVDKDLGARVCHGKWKFEIDTNLSDKFPKESFIKANDNIYLTDGKARVIMEHNGNPTMTSYDFGRGKGIYLASFETNEVNTRMLMNLLLYATKEEKSEYITDNVYTECAYYPNSKTIIVVNNSDIKQNTKVCIEGIEYFVELQPFANKVIITK